MATKSKAPAATLPAPKTSNYIDVPILIQVDEEGNFEAAAWSRYAPENYMSELFSGELTGSTYSCWVTVRIPKTHLASNKYVYEVPSK